MFREAVEFPRIPTPALSVSARGRKSEIRPANTDRDLRFDEIDEIEATTDDEDAE